MCVLDPEEELLIKGKLLSQDGSDPEYGSRGLLSLSLSSCNRHACCKSGVYRRSGGSRPNVR